MQAKKFLLGLSLVLFALPLQARAPLPQRIASGTVGTDEILLELLGKKGELHRLIAVSIFSENPAYSLLGPIPASIRGRVGNNVESLLALKPDLAILASYNRLELAAQLQAAKVDTLIQEHFRNLGDIYANISALGQRIGLPGEAETLVKTMQTQIETWKRSRATCSDSKTPRILLHSDSGSFPGQNTTFESAAMAAGFINVISELGLNSWAPLSQEVLVGLDPDWIVTSGSTQEFKPILKKLRSEKIWGRFRAIREGHVIVIPEALLSTVSQHIVELVATLHKKHACRS